MEKQATDLKLARKLVSLAVKVKRLEKRQGELEAEIEKLKKETELRLKLLEDEVREW